MENPDFEDEVIADSEDEIDPNVTMDMDHNKSFRGNGFNQTSSVSAFTTAVYPQAKTFSAISKFTGETPVRPYLPEDISGVSNQRGPGQADTSISSITNTFTDFEGMGNIADRAKMRQRTQKKTLVDPSDVIELSSSEDDEIGVKPSTSKTKPAPKPKIKTKQKEKAKEIPLEDIEAPNVSVNLPSVPAKLRPRPVPIRKRKKTPQSEDMGLGTSTPGPELPVATSSPRMPHLNSSRLPPSDPPISTFNTEYNHQNGTGLPRIETLPKSMPAGQPSSPSSLFSDVDAGKKRYGGSADSEVEIDELAGSDDGPVGYYTSKRSQLLRQMPPPPTFFAGSSSLPSNAGGEAGGEGNVLPPDPGPRHEIVDLTDPPATMVPITSKSKPSPKPKKPKKKKSSDHDALDDITVPLVILDEDDEDDDFDPAGDGAKKKKGKSKDKEKKGKNKPKTKEPKTPPDGAQVEVLITTKPPKAKTKKKETSGAKTKSKEKDKEAMKAGAGDKEVFKSREFIEDSDGDDPLQLVDGSSSAFYDQLHTSSGPAVQDKDKDIASSSSAKLTITIPGPTSPSNLPKTVEPDLGSPLSDLEVDMPKAKSSKGKNSGGGKKRKSIVDSDREGEEAVKEKEDDDTPSKSKKRKTDGSGKKKEKSTAGRKGKAKPVVLSEEEEEQESCAMDLDKTEAPVQVQNKDSGKKKLSKIILDDEDKIQSSSEEPKADSQENISKPRNVDKSTKENNAPPVPKAQVMATPRPSKPIPLNDDGTTPIYARYEIAPRRSSLPMSELIRRANSMPGSPFSTPNNNTPSASTSKSKFKPLLARTPSSTAYSPYLKSSRSLLSRIAPLHPNRRTPPPPPPPPPPRKKTKKELELEAKWEEEMVEEAGGMEAWAAMQDDERKEMRKIKWARELGGWDD